MTSEHRQEAARIIEMIVDHFPTESGDPAHDPYTQMERHIVDALAAADARGRATVLWIVQEIAGDPHGFGCLLGGTELDGLCV